MRLTKALSALLLIIVVAACQSTGRAPELVPQTTDKSQWQRDPSYFAAAQKKLTQLHAWQLTAKVAVATPQLKESANLVWNFRDQSNQLRMFGPLGAGAIRLDFDQFGVQLSDGKGILHRGESAEQLLTDIVGWPIPVDALSYWVFGLPHPHYTYEFQLDAEGRISELRQRGWRVSYSAYLDAAPAGWEGQLARKISALRTISDNQQVRVKLVTKGWQPK